ncbi:hypothetical protein [Bacillus nitratireducens]|uniref:hypothetical protein n=1 Tax=Bacillus nitratireducens TaxID=2026193 RepID=UPI000BECC667|nr:hypothetical protein [Bacillus nitratireducens]PDY08457.1 hypothetical protein COM83_32110 [Bacillus cereus]PFJ45218.1 hypothetical protein COI99_28480 [Bacillus cereus]PFW08785.1 hypothetical protein COL18_26600 [Bacillus cereus]PGW92600.1 hypothetical protein COE40_30035 [Bacillus cereus]PGY15581.1 hypothetical protein COE16_26375 [Bacillus cereus]
MQLVKFNHTGELVESFSLADSTGDLIKDAELFYTGNHRGKTYTVDHLQALVNSFDPEDMVPVQLDHSESAKDTVGLLESVSVKGNKLIGKLRIIEDSIKSRVQKGLAKKISVSFYTDEKGNPTRIREVSLVAFPQLKGAQLFHEQAATHKYTPKEVYQAFSVTMEAIAKEEQSFEEEYKQYVKSLGIK